MTIRQALADAIHEADEWVHPRAGDIKGVEFRRGCAEIEVTYLDNGHRESQVVDAAPILTLLVQERIDQ